MFVIFLLKKIEIRKNWKTCSLMKYSSNLIYLFLFTVNYWLKLCYHLQIKVKYNTAFYFQTNKQTERQNQTLKQYLRCYVNYQQNDWTKWLNLTEYAYNNSWYNVEWEIWYLLLLAKGEFLSYKCLAEI